MDLASSQRGQRTPPSSELRSPPSFVSCKEEHDVSACIGPVGRDLGPPTIKRPPVIEGRHSVRRHRILTHPSAQKFGLALLLLLRFSFVWRDTGRRWRPTPSLNSPLNSQPSILRYSGICKMHLKFGKSSLRLQPWKESLVMRRGKKLISDL